MRLASFITSAQPHDIRLGISLQDCIVDLQTARTWAQGACSLAGEDLPHSIHELLHTGQGSISYIQRIANCLDGVSLVDLKGANRAKVAYRKEEVALLPPLLHPPTIREFLAFEQPTRQLFTWINKNLPEGWQKSPPYFYANVNAVQGPEIEISIPSYSTALDFQLEIACVIGKYGINIPQDKAEEYIAGYVIMNGWCARDVQKLNLDSALGFAHSRDFAISIGPYLVTPDELANHKNKLPGVFGLNMVARLNGKEVSRACWSDITIPFSDMIAEASRGTYLVPGDILASGPTPGASLLEINQMNGPWLQPGDRVELEIEKLGILRNSIRAGSQPAD